MIRWTSSSARNQSSGYGFPDRHQGFSVIRPHGPLPTLIFLITRCVGRSTTETSLDGPFAVYNDLPSGETANPHGRSPASNDAIARSVEVSITKTFFPRPVLTYALLPSAETTMPIGLTPGPERGTLRRGSWRIASTTVTNPSFSAVT